MKLIDLNDGSGRLWLTDGRDFGMYADAVPELLTALEDIAAACKYADEDPEDCFYFWKARAAIAKARNAVVE